MHSEGHRLPVTGMYVLIFSIINFYCKELWIESSSGSIFTELWGSIAPSPPGSATGIFTKCGMITNLLSSFRSSVSMMVYLNTQLSFSVLK